MNVCLPSAGRLKIRRRKKGFILLFTSWSVMILALVLMSQLRRVETSFESLRIAETDLRLRMAATSALNQMLAAMQADVQSGESGYDARSEAWGWATVREQFRQDFETENPDVRIEVAIEDEDAKLNLLNARPESLSTLFQAFGWGRLAADLLAADIQDLTAAREQAASGAGAGEIAGQAGGDRWMSLQYLQEIPELSWLLVDGEDLNFNGVLDENENDGEASFPPDNRDGNLQIGLARFLTLKGDGIVNPNMAPYEILLTVPGISRRIAQEIVWKRSGADKIEGTPDDFVFRRADDLRGLSSVSQFEEFEFSRMSPHMRMTSNRFTIRLCGWNETRGQMFRIQTSVMRTDEGEVRVLSWLEDNGF